jgi:hypothetical protein
MAFLEKRPRPLGVVHNVTLKHLRAFTPCIVHSALRAPDIVGIASRPSRPTAVVLYWRFLAANVY